MTQKHQILIPLIFILLLVSIGTISRYATYRRGQIIGQSEFYARFCEGQPVNTWRPAKRQLCGVGIFLNSDTAEELAYLPNIGPKRARAIAHYRRVHGPFKSLAELANVSGIGPKTILQIHPWIEDVPWASTQQHFDD